MNSKFETYCICLERRGMVTAMKAHLYDHGFKQHTIFKAIDGKRLDYDELLSAGVIGQCQIKNMSKGEYGCALSHVLVWRDFLLRSNKEYLLVFEDDVRISKNRQEFEDIDFPMDMDVIQLGWGHRTPMHFPTSDDIQRVPALSKTPYGAYCYAMSRRGASKFVKLSRTVNEESDYFFNRGHEKKFNCYVKRDRMSAGFQSGVHSTADHGRGVKFNN